MAKLILASTNKGDMVLDPFSGSGTTVVTSKKLERKYIGIELNKKYLLITAKRMLWANESKRIQGFYGGVFWERNTGKTQKK